MGSFPDIAFVGKAGSGKTTCAQYLQDNFGYTPMSFAQSLKDVAVRLYGEQARSDRGLLQDVGLALRTVDPDVFARATVRQIDQLRKVRALDPRASFVAIDDCRFENEYDALKAAGFVFVRLECGRFQRIDRLKATGKFQNEEQLEHVSETALDHIEMDYTFYNSNSDNLLGQVREIVMNVFDGEAKRS